MDSAAFRLRYSRWYDRALGLVWPPKRRSLRMAQALLKASEADLRLAMDRLLLDLRLYGTTFVDAGGRRIDPKEIRADHA